LIGGDAELDLTTDGETLHASLREYIAGPTARLLGQFDPADVETTVRTLRAIADRAADELVVAGPDSSRGRSGLGCAACAVARTQTQTQTQARRPRRSVA
jgi:hypothetical protein